MQVRKIILTIFSFCLFHIASAQAVPKLPYHPDSYHLLIPKGWLKPRLVSAITDILPQTLEQLKNKDFCTDCTADYTVMLILDSISFRSGDNITTLINPIIDSFPDIAKGIISFYAAFRLFDSSGKAVIDLQLVNTEEDISASQPYEMRMQKIPPAAPYDVELIRTMRGTVAYLRNTSLYNNLPATPVYRKVPDSNYISFMGICEKRIYQIRRILRRLVNSGAA